jgi:hypothetical protein
VSFAGIGSDRGDGIEREVLPDGDGALEVFVAGVKFGVPAVSSVPAVAGIGALDARDSRLFAAVATGSTAMSARAMSEIP